MNGFVRAMLWRESRSSWKRLLLFILSISAGVGGLVSVKSFSYGLEGAIRREARTLMASDLSLRSHRPFTSGEEAELASLVEQGAGVTRVLGFDTMGLAPSTGKALLVTVRAVGREYPFYGKVVTASGRPFRELLKADTLLVQPELLLRFGLSVGDDLRIGTKVFSIAGQLLSEPDRPVQIFSMGPRVLMDGEGVEETGLIGPTSHMHYHALIKLPEGRDPVLVANEMKANLPERFASIRTYDESQPSVRRFLSRLTNYLNLVGLSALILGGIGVAGAIRVFLAQKLDTLAILKCLGATSANLLSVYLSLSILLGLVGSLVGAGFGLAVQGILTGLLRDFLPVSFGFTLAWRAVLEGVAMGLMTTLWFALPPLLALKRVPPARVFRRQVESETPRRIRLRRAALTQASALLLVSGLVLWQVGAGKIAAIALGGLVGSYIALQVSAWGLLALLRRLPKPTSFTLKQGLSSLYRPGNQTSAVVVSMGLGVLLVLAVFLIQSDLLQQVAAGSPKDQPNLFFLDVQKSQREDFTAILARHGVPDPELIPLVRGRLRSLNGKRVRLDEVDDPELRRILGFEYAVTYRGSTVEGEKVVEGRFEPDPGIAGFQVSVADWWADATEMGIGDKVTLDIQGVNISATINSIRRVEWQNRRANFSFVFLPGALEEAPQYFISAVSIPGGAGQVASVQQEVTEELPNVSAIDVAVIFTMVQQIIDRIALVVQFMAGFSVVVGLVTLVGTIATTKFQRLREAVLFKILGAGRVRTAGVMAVEYLLLGVLSGLIGVTAAGGFSWGLVTQIFGGEWRFNPTPYLAAWGLTAGLILIAGLVSSLDVLMKKPLQVLREE